MRRLGLVWVCLAIIGVGCSKPDQPGTLPPKPSASVSASRSATPPSPGDPKAAVVALVRSYYAESNIAINTGNTTRMRALATSTCPCLAVASHIERSWRNGSIKAPNYYIVTEVSFAEFAAPKIADVNVFYKLNQAVTLDSSGKQIDFSAAEPKLHSAMVECHLVAGEWKVANVIRL